MAWITWCLMSFRAVAPNLSSLAAWPDVAWPGVAGAHIHAQLHLCEQGAHVSSPYANWPLHTSRECLCSCPKLHSCEWRALEWRVHKANGASCMSTSALCSHEWSFVHKHLPFSPMVWFQTGHGPVVGHGPGVGDPCFRNLLLTEGILRSDIQSPKDYHQLSEASSLLDIVIWIIAKSFLKKGL